MHCHLRLKGRFPSGTRLIPAQLVGELGLGLAAIRDAIRELVGSGLIINVPNKGNFVSPSPKSDELREIFALRLIIEADAAKKGAVRLTTEEVSRMEKIFQEMSQDYIQQEEYFLLNREFHMILYNASGWKNLCRIIGQMNDHILLFYSGQLTSNGIDIKVFNNEHLRIIEAIKAKKPKEVQRLIKVHVKLGRDNILEKIIDKGTH